MYIYFISEGGGGSMMSEIARISLELRGRLLLSRGERVK